MIKNRLSCGFTLIEILVAASIMITATTVVVAVLSSSFRGIAKSNINEDIRQNGTSAIQRMSRTIQFAESFKGVSNDISDASFDTTCAVPTQTYKYLRIKASGLQKTLTCDSDIDKMSISDCC